MGILLAASGCVVQRHELGRRGVEVVAGVDGGGEQREGAGCARRDRPRRTLYPLRRGRKRFRRLQGMTIEGDYEPGAWDWVNQQVQAYEDSGGQEATTLQGTTMPIVVITTRGHRSGKVREFALMRVEHDGEYAGVASKGGMPADPGWVHNLRADPAGRDPAGRAGALRGDRPGGRGRGTGPRGGSVRRRPTPTTPSTRRTPSA